MASQLTKIFISTLLALCCFSAASLAQGLTGPTEVCLNTNYNYSYFDDQYIYTSVQWNAFGGTIVSGSGSNRVISWYSTSGTLRLTLKNGSVTTAVLDFPISGLSVGYINNPFAGTASGKYVVCPSATFSLTQQDANGASFTWQRKASNQSTWTTIGTRSANGYVTVSITQDTDFRIIGGCDNSTTPVLTVYVATATTPGTISATGTTICSGSMSPDLTSVAFADGAAIAYQWQKRVAGGAWTTIAGATSATYVPGTSLTLTTDFRRMATGCVGPAVFSNEVTITVNSAAVGGITAASTTTVCQGDAPAVTLSLSGQNGYIEAWYFQYSDNNGSSWSAQTATNNPATPATSTGGRIYRYFASVKNGVCPSVNSSLATVTVTSSDVGTVTPASQEYYGSASNTLTINGGLGNVVKWQYNQNGTWADIAHTEKNYTLTNVTNSQGYRAVVNNNSCVYTTNTAWVTVYPAPAIHYSGSSRPALALGKSLTLHANASYHSYQWRRNGQTIPGATANNYTATEPGAYQLAVKGAANSQEAYSQLFTVHSLASWPDTTANKVVTTFIRKQGVTPSTNLYQSLAPTDYLQQVTYLDGFSRPLQNISLKSSPQGQDMVQPHAYDSLGLASTVYSPYASDGADGFYRTGALGAAGGYTASEQYLFYQNTPRVATDTHPYARTVYVNDPTLRVIEQGAPGADWQPLAAGQAGGSGHTVQSNFTLNNTTTHAVRQWQSNDSTTGLYPANTVRVDITTDENGNQVRTFTDSRGLTVLKQVQMDESLEGVSTPWLETYYIYDIYGRLRYQVPPKAMKVLGTGASLNATASSVAELVYTYTYDGRGRLVEKKVPGSVPEFYVYDIYDRLVLTQSADARFVNKWMFVKYDVYGRAIAQGLYTNSRSRASVQAWVNKAYGVASTAYPAANYAEDKSAAGAHGYTNRSFPKDSIEYMQVSYFDSYDFDGNGTPDYGYDNTHLPGQESSAFSYVRGMPTGSKRAIINDWGTVVQQWISTVVFYDAWQRPIQVRSNNFLAAAMGDVQTMVYDFSGQVLKTKTTSATNRITWQNRVNTTAEADRLASTATTSSWTTGASSQQQIPAGTDGWLQTVVTETNKDRAIGLSDADVNQHHSTIDYAFYLSGTFLSVYENGVSKLLVTNAMANGDVLRMERVGTTVRYYRNGTLVHTSTVPSTTLLMADAAFNTFGGTLGYTQLSAAQSPVLTTEQRYIYDHAGRTLAVLQRINDQQEQVVAAYEYNALGQLVDKKLHCVTCQTDIVSTQGVVYDNDVERSAYNANESTLIGKTSVRLLPGYHVAAGQTLTARTGISQQDFNSQLTNSGNFLQSIDYRYTIRGWLQSINNGQLTMDNGVTNDDPNDYFGMELMYNTVENELANAAYYNGNISALKWKGPGQGSGARGLRSYKYTYDKSDRLKTAAFQAYGGQAWNQEVNTLNETMTYDHNGNIKTLVRSENQRGLSGLTVTSTPLTIDNLTYTYASNLNRITKVEDAGTTSGFGNGVNAATEYFYSSGGSLYKDDNKGISSILYNVLGQPRQVTFTNGKRLDYTYDAAGNKLRVKTWQGTTAQSVTEYEGNRVYENGSLSFFGSPEGRVVKKGAAYEYEYAIADHQGNTRVVFSSVAPAPLTYTATFENDTQPGEQSTFQNYPTGANRSSFNLFDHTDAGTAYDKSQLLTGGTNSQVGLSKSFKVYPGDKVKVEAYAKYLEPTSTASNLTGFAGALTGAFGVSAASTGEALKVYSGLNSYGGVVAAGGGNGSSTAPKAFVNIIIFDKDYKFLDIAWQQVSTAAQQIDVNPTPHEYLMREYTVKEAGYAFVYVSNENATLAECYFDDITMTHTKGNVIQYNEYYASQLQNALSWTRENVTGNNFLANGSTELNPASNFYDLEYRTFDPVLMRMNGVDPMASKYASLTPYNYSFNDPVSFTDPSGAEPDYYREEAAQRAAAQRLGRVIVRNNVGGSIMQPIRRSLGRIGHWSDGIGYSDWSLNGGSETYQQGLAMGLTDIGGTLYRINGDGTRTAFGEQNGQLGFFESYSEYDLTGFSGTSDGMVLPGLITGLRFVAFDQQTGCPTCPNPQPGPSLTDVLLAGIGTAGLVAEYQTAIIQGSRSGFTSGKLSPNSPRVYSKATAGKINIAAKSVGWGLTIWSVANTEIQFDKGQINANRRVYNHINNGVGLVYPVVGLPMAAGDYLGQKYSTEIVNDVSQPGGFLFEGTKFVLEFLGIPTSPRK